MTRVFKLRSKLLGGHIHTTVFIGDKGRTLENSGEIIHRVDEVGDWQVLGAMLGLGADKINSTPGHEGQVEVICEGDDVVVDEIGRRTTEVVEKLA